MFLANNLNKGGSLTAVDPQFNYVTMLLHGDGTNGAQNNTFLDSSTNNFTITRNGNTTQGSFSPYGSNWSNFFNGSNAYFTTPSSSEFNFGTGSFTIEAWVYINSASAYAVVVGGNGSFGQWFVEYSSNRGFVVYDGAATLTTSVTTALTGQWVHLAVVRNGATSVAIYQNGVSVGTASSVGFASTFSLGIGAYSGGSSFLNGYISNLRIVKGTAVYTSNFTPSTTPLIAVSGTSLLTCQSNRFIDNSSNAFSLTVGGTPSVQRFNPFGASTAYSTNVIGGSGYFDGSGDYLQVSANSFSTSGTWTIEAWVYLTSDINYDYIVCGLASDRLYIQWAGTNFLVGDAIANNIVVNNNKPLNQWLHVAVVKNGSTYTAYFNGVSVGSSTTALTSTTLTDWQIGGRSSNGGYTKGYISNLRIVTSAVYTSNFTPPTSPVTAITNTQLLTNYTNGAIFDNAMMNDLEGGANAQISTSVKKYGTGSIYLDGTDDYLETANSPVLQFGTGDFTVEGWFYLTTNARTNNDFFSIGSYNSGILLRYINTGVNFDSLYINGTNYNWNPASNFSLNQWNHVALVRNGSAVAIYVNGVSVFTTTNSASIVQSTNTCIGTATHDRNNENWTGYIDDFRITKGYARYTANFTPPTAAFPNTGPI